MMHTTSRALILLSAIGFCGCGGATTTESGNANQDAGPSSSQVCGVLADSGFTFAQCLAENCCAFLNACIQEGDARAYQICLSNCTFDGGAFAPDGGTCADTCGAAHPRSAAACGPYYDCAVQACSPRHK